MKRYIIIFMILVILLYSGCSKQIEKPQQKLTTEKITIRQSGGSAILILECSNNSYINESSDYIIEGIVEKVESKWNDEKTSIFTYTTLLIENYIKGDSLGRSKLQIVTSGGGVGEITQAVEDQPIFHEGKRVRIFINEINGEFSIVCAKLGIQEIY